MNTSVPAKGWHVEVDHPNGETIEPEVVGDPSRNPQINGYPRLDIPVEKRPIWDEINLDDNIVPMRVWYNGRPQPVDELEKIDGGEGATRTLKGRGGLELRNKVREEWQSIPYYEAADYIISNYTSYTANVDRPTTTVRENVSVQSKSSVADIAAAAIVDETTPIGDRGDGTYGVLQTCFTTEAENPDQSSGTSTAFISTFSGGEGINFSSVGDQAEYTFTLNHAIPEGEFDLFLRYRADSDPIEISVSLDGTTLGTTAVDTALTDVHGSIMGDLSDPGRVEPGEHKLTCEVTGSGSSDQFWDVISPADGRYSYVLDNDNGGSDGYLDGPQYFPPSVTCQFEDATDIDAFVGGRIEITANDLSNNQTVELSNDRGENYPLSASNTDTLEDDFADPGSFLRWRGTFGRTSDTRTTATPQTGYKGQGIEDYTLKADLEDLPLLVDQAPEGSVADVLTGLANDSDSLWELRMNLDGTISVEWSEPGQRISDRDEPIARFRSSRTVENAIEKVTVKGSKQRVRGESLTANNGSWVSLSEDDILKGQEALYDPATGTEYTLDEDYRLRGQSGEIRTLSSGSISDGQNLEIDYFFKPKNSYTASGAGSDPVEETVDLPGLPTERACGQVARRIVQQLNEELKEATVVIPADKAGWNVIEAQSFDVLPFDGHVEIREIENTPTETVQRLGSRQTFSETVNRFRERLDSASGRV